MFSLSFILIKYLILILRNLVKVSFFKRYFRLNSRNDNFLGVSNLLIILFFIIRLDDIS